MNSISRRIFCQSLGAGLLASATSGQRVDRPNIVFVLADDLGWGDLHSYNENSAIPTPNADRLAREGMRFTDMHSSSAVCSPSRYSILTGRYCWRSSLKKGVLSGYSPNLIEPGRLTLPVMLKSAGYYTAGVGKWHLGLGTQDPTDYSKPLRPGPLDHGFDYYYGIPASLDMDPYLYFENDHVVKLATTFTPGSKDPRGVFWRPGAITPGFEFEKVLPNLTAKAVNLIAERAAEPAPFFLYFAMPSPHTPWVPTAQFRGRSKAGDYGDYAAEVDDCMGQLLRAVDQHSSTNTLFIFTSDNGADWKIGDAARYAHRANAGWKGEKADIWEAGHRIPFLARWPDHIKAGASSSQLGCLSDFMATAAAITGMRLPDTAAEDSYSLLPAMVGKQAGLVRTDIVSHSIDGMFAIRRGDWKLEEGLGSGGFTAPAHVEPAGDGPKGQLYNLTADPAEQDNLYQKRPDVVDGLASLLDKYKREGRSRPLPAQ
jgi:arylsulfatase A-like enzyme